MLFHVYQCKEDPDFFVVTDEAHLDSIVAELCPRGGELEKVGEFPEMGETRAAFNETLAKGAIESQGYYRFEAKTFRVEGEPPATMP